MYLCRVFFSEYMSYLRLILRFLRCNILQTLRINFQMLPWRQALRLPIFVHGRFKLRGTRGRIVLPDKVSTGMIIIGKRDYSVATAIPQSIWTINGTLTFAGRMKFAHGSYLLVADGAELSFGTGGTYCGTNFKVMCFEKITIGHNVRMAWDVQIMDSSFHYIQLVEKDNAIPPLTKPVLLAGNIWIGNRTTIAKGAQVPQEVVIASNSLVNKDFSSIKPYSLLAGAPATLKATGIRRIWDEEQQRALDQQYHYHRTHL